MDTNQVRYNELKMFHLVKGGKCTGKTNINFINKIAQANKLSLLHPKLNIDIPMFNVKYLAMDERQIHAGAISKLLYGLCVCTGR